MVGLPTEVHEDYSVPYLELARLSEPSAVNHRTVGLTRAKFGYRSTLELDGLEDPRGGRACARPQVRVDVEVTGMTVYVAREYRGDACREPLILAHERLHVAVFERYAAEAAPALARELEGRVGHAVRYGATIEAVQDALKRELAAHLEAFMDRSRAELDRRHALIDTRRRVRPHHAYLRVVAESRRHTSTTGPGGRWKVSAAGSACRSPAAR